MFALLFNVVVGSTIALASGLNPMAVIGIGAGLSLIPTGQTGLGMAIQKEIWLNSIIEPLFADSSFLSKAFNADEFVTAGKVVHIPNSGAASAVVKNRTSFPAAVSGRTDVDLTFNLEEYTTDPIKITNADKAELSYNKRESAIKNDKAALIETVSNDFLYKWSPAAAYTIETTGAAVPGHAPTATGNRKAFTKADLKTAMDKMNAQNVPQTGRYALIDAVMYGQLLDSLTTQESMAFHAAIDVKNGIVGKLYGFNVMIRAKAALYTSAKAPKDWTAAAAATDCAAALCWHEGSVCRALGETQMFDSENNPLYYADIYSFLVRAGGRPMRNDVAGLWAIVQVATA